MRSLYVLIEPSFLNLPLYTYLDLIGLIPAGIGLTSRTLRFYSPWRSFRRARLQYLRSLPVRDCASISGSGANDPPPFDISASSSSELSSSMRSGIISSSTSRRKCITTRIVDMVNLSQNCNNRGLLLRISTVGSPGGLSLDVAWGSTLGNSSSVAAALDGTSQHLLLTAWPVALSSPGDQLHE